ncbi:hypothetical protein Syun_031295 [Stephania yunnanensis]|uniref:Uncharacterized protein n=1 Tax=Stephania yunnanensis TaxID=152371 RepID=A0AAP0HBU6_9MAGN
MVHDLEPARSLNLRMMDVRKAIVNAKIPYTSLQMNCFARYFVPNLYQLGSFLPPKDKISIFGDNNAKGGTSKVYIRRGRGEARWRETREEGRSKEQRQPSKEQRHKTRERRGGTSGGGRRTSSRAGRRADLRQGSAEQSRKVRGRGTRRSCVGSGRRRYCGRGARSSLVGTIRLSGGEGGGPVKEELYAHVSRYVAESSLVWRFKPAEFCVDPARMVHDLEPARSLNLRMMDVRKAIVNAKIPYTSVAANCFASISTTTQDDKSKVRCGTDQRPLKTTNLRFVAEHINDHLRRQETDSDVAESKQRNCRTVDIRVDDGHIAKAT